MAAWHTDADLFHQWEEAEERAEKWQERYKKDESGTSVLLVQVCDPVISCNNTGAINKRQNFEKGLRNVKIVLGAVPTPPDKLNVLTTLRANNLHKSEVEK